MNLRDTFYKTVKVYEICMQVLYYYKIINIMYFSFLNISILHLTFS